MALPAPAEHSNPIYGRAASFFLVLRLLCLLLGSCHVCCFLGLPYHIGGTAMGWGGGGLCLAWKGSHRGTDRAALRTPAR
jgi:hypothetical protein